MQLGLRSNQMNFYDTMKKENKSYIYNVALPGLSTFQLLCGAQTRCCLELASSTFLFFVSTFFLLCGGESRASGISSSRLYRNRALVLYFSSHDKSSVVLRRVVGVSANSQKCRLFGVSVDCQKCWPIANGWNILEFWSYGALCPSFQVFVILAINPCNPCAFPQSIILIIYSHLDYIISII